MYYPSKVERLESRLALGSILAAGLNAQVSDDESEQNIVSNLVTVAALREPAEIPKEGGATFKSLAAGTGLRLTTDGFILTAYHVIHPFEAEWQSIMASAPSDMESLATGHTDFQKRYFAVDNQAAAYPIDPTFLAYDPDYDIAIIKAIIPGRPMPIRFKMMTEDFQMGQEIRLFSLINQRQYYQRGRVNAQYHNAFFGCSEKGVEDYSVCNTFLTNARSLPGCSGGIFTNMHGELGGVVLYSEFNENQNYSGGAKVSNIRFLLKEVVKAFHEQALI